MKEKKEEATRERAKVHTDTVMIQVATPADATARGGSYMARSAKALSLVLQETRNQGRVFRERATKR